MQPTDPVPTLAAYRPEFAEEARKLALTRATDEALARHFDPDVVDGLHRNAAGFVHEVVGRPAGADAEPARVLRRRPPNRRARHFWLVNRLPGAWCAAVREAATGG